MQRKIKIALVSMALLIIASPTLACQPCFQQLGDQQSVEQADLVIIGSLSSSGPDSCPTDNCGGSDWIDIAVDEVIFGETLADTVRVNSWDGMCNYGITIENDKDYIILLDEEIDENTDYEYDAVNMGCAVKTFLIDDDEIIFDDQIITVDQFISSNYSDKNCCCRDNTAYTYFPFYFALAVAIILILILLIYFLDFENKWSNKKPTPKRKPTLKKNTKLK